MALYVTLLHKVDIGLPARDTPRPPPARMTSHSLCGASFLIAMLLHTVSSKMAAVSSVSVTLFVIGTMRRRCPVTDVRTADFAGCGGGRLALTVMDPGLHGEQDLCFRVGGKWTRSMRATEPVSGSATATLLLEDKPTVLEGPVIHPKSPYAAAPSRLAIVCCDGGIQEAHGLFHDRAKNNLNTTVKWICRGGWLIELVRKHSDHVLIFLKEYVAIRADMDDGSDCRLHGEYSEPVQELRVTERTCQNCGSIGAVQKCDHAAKVWRIYAVAEAPTSQEDSTSSTFKAITMSVMEPDDGAYDPQSVTDALERFVLREEVISGPNVYGTSRHASRPASPH